MENKLSSLCAHLAKHLENRITANPTPGVIKTMGKCLDLKNILKEGIDTEIKKSRQKCLKVITKKAMYNEEETNEIVKQYDTFQERFKDLMNTSKDNHEIVKRFEHILFEIHNCSIACDKDCDKQGKVLEPRTPKVFKLLYLFLKEVSLYSGLEEFLHLYLRCLVKTHAEGVAESMGNYIEIHGDKRRGRMEIEDTGNEALIHWNGPPLHLADQLGRQALDRHFASRGRWSFITQSNRTESTVIKRMKKEDSKLPFF